MSRPKTSIQVAALEQLAKHLAAGADVALVRVMFPTVPQASWYRWVEQARKAHAAKGKKLPPKDKPLPPARGKRKKAAPPPPPPEPEAMPSPPLPKRRPGRPKKSGTPTATPEALAAKEAAKRARQALVPAESPASTVKIPREEGGTAGILRFDEETEAETYEVMTMFGAKESSVIPHFVDKVKPGVPDPVAVMERVSDQFTHAEALMRSAIKRVGTGHAIIDPQAFASGVDLQLKSMKLLHAVMKDARNLDSVQRFVLTITDLLRREDPAFARKVSQLLREAGRVFLSTSPQGAG